MAIIIEITHRPAIGRNFCINPSIGRNICVDTSVNRNLCIDPSISRNPSTRQSTELLRHTAVNISSARFFICIQKIIHFSASRSTGSHPVLRTEVEARVFRDLTGVVEMAERR